MYSPKIVGQNREKYEKKLGISLIESSPTDILDLRDRLGRLDWVEEPQLALSQVSPADRERIEHDILLSSIDFRYWLARHCYLMGSDKVLRPFSTLWPGQDRLLTLLGQLEEAEFAKRAFAKLKVIILKARQLGQTAIAEAIVAHMTFLQRNTQAIVGSDDPDNTRAILYVPLMRMYDNLPAWMKPIRDAKVKASNLHFPLLDSDIVYVSGNQKTTLGQGLTVDIAHLTELSTWIKDCTDGIDEDLIPAFNSSEKHHSLLLLESTGAGATGNWFHDQWRAAAVGESNFKPIFLPWYMRPSWSMPAEGIIFEDETLSMAGRVLRETGDELSREQIAWWQTTKNDYKAQDKLDMFQQEFPSVVEEAFHTGYRSVFNIELRSKLRDQVRKPVMVWEWDPFDKHFLKEPVNEWLKRDDEGKYLNRLLIWEPKQPAGHYFVGVDASHGTTGGDNAAVEVMRVSDRHRPDEQVAEWCGNIEPGALAEVVWKIGHMYNVDGHPAKVAVEVNPGSPGMVTQEVLQQMRYPNFFRWAQQARLDRKPTWKIGWHTTPGTRPRLTQVPTEAIKKGWLVVNSVAFIKEMSTFVNTGDTLKGERHLEHAPGEHDDRIIALYIAFQVAHWDDQASVAEQRAAADLRKKAIKSEIGPELRIPRDAREMRMTQAELNDQWEHWVRGQLHSW